MKFAAWIEIVVIATCLKGVAEPVDYPREVKPLLAEQCYKCHGASQHKGGLRLDTREFTLKGGDHGAAIKVGESAESLMMSAVEGTRDDISRMPYKKPPLTTAQIGVLKRWIDEGAHAPADEKPETSKHWAFILPERPAIPRLATLKPVNPIDAFVRARLDREGIAPSPEADRVTLIRRLSLDLTGLPPTLAEVEEFVRDPRPDAYFRLVDRLLVSPHYGERWGRWWLDAARYADSNGYSIDAPRQIWKYRDWVIVAMNDDMPFDQFIIEQIAGDLLPDPTVEERIATGFHRNSQINQEGGIDPEQFRVESVMDRVNTTATVFLGVTLACAQCHDHKFDPFTQREYYEMFAFFNSAEHDGHGKGDSGPALELPTTIELAARDSHRQRLDKAQDELKAYEDGLREKARDWESKLDEEHRKKLKADVQSAIALPPAERNTAQSDAAFAAFRDQDEGFRKLRDQAAKLKRDAPEMTSTLVMKELASPRETHVFIKGDFTRPGEIVGPGVPAVLHPMHADRRAGRGILNRLDLARWIVSPENPLTGRVIVNRVWQQLFGKGIVETENDFGSQGARPTHPELLDWLALEFMNPTATRSGGDTAMGWSLKNLQRLIVSSAVYRQSSRLRPELRDVDPNNHLLARQSRLRLDAETVRDVCLASSGLLSVKMGGPPVNPPQPDGVMTLGQSKHAWIPSEGEDRYRRGLYTRFFRATPHPALVVFDAPEAFGACTRRIRSNTPLQALTLLNDRQFFEMAEGLAARIQTEGPAGDSDKLAFAFRVCLARTPDDVERKRLDSLLSQQLSEAGGDAPKKQKEAWTTVARVLLNLDEAITRE